VPEGSIAEEVPRRSGQVVSRDLRYPIQPLLDLIGRRFFRQPTGASE
jgi:hypothetical protein